MVIMFVLLCFGIFSNKHVTISQSSPCSPPGPPFSSD
uniref:Uncharacterized protein n=1 Tax=Anguilla anguilla TaxID=7936 RepID=A0A0E9XJD2_ANGAN